MRCSSSFLLLISIILLLFYYTFAEARAAEANRAKWELLTKRNFSSQIRDHNHILLLITVPWCGESQSLMKKVSHLVSSKQEEFGILKLMLLYRNSEKMLADALGASEGISLFYYHHSTAYKYNGRLWPQNILSSIYNFMLLPNEEIPLKPLHTNHDLENLFQSTDKAVILLDFCGWSNELLHRRIHEVNETTRSLENQPETAGLFEENLSREEGAKIATDNMKNQKVQGPKNEEFSCGIESGFMDSPFRGGFIQRNQSDGMDVSCTAENYQKFKIIFFEFLKVAREHFLPFERHRFGLISDRSLLPYLNVGNIDTWSVVLQFSGANNSMMVNEANDLRALLRTHHTLIKEIDPDGSIESMIPANRPSVIAFIDRSSDSSKIRGESNSALQILRKFIKDNDYSSTVNQIIPDHSLQKSVKYVSPKVVNLKENMDLMIMNKGQAISLDAISGDQGNSLHNILANLLHHKKTLASIKETKISLLAKEVGFQLLSDDFKVQILDSSPSQIEDSRFYINDNVITSNESFNDEDQIEIHKQNPERVLYCPSNINKLATIIAKELEDNMQSFTCPVKDIFSLEKESPTVEKPIEELNAKQIYMDDVDEIINSLKTSIINEWHVKKHPFEDSFFFSDGDYKLLRSLTGELKIPSLVIIDPVIQCHYVYEQIDINYSSLAKFLDSFLNGSLAPYQLTASPVKKSREYPRPPFVNHDFHEADSIPRVTAKTFCEIIFGYKPCKTGNELSNTHIQNNNLAWKTDALVMFSTTWCGFCQRMELIVREVHRAFKHFTTVLNNESTIWNSRHIQDHTEDTMPNGLPSIFLMDCTFNDCGALLKPISKELYPKLVLFPAENKTAITYEGDMSVTNIIEFLTSHGRNSHHLTRHKGFLWNPSWKGSKSHSTKYDKSSLPHKVENSAKIKYNSILLSKESGDNASPVSDQLHYGERRLVAGTLLDATDKLVNAFPFNNATILIVKADKNHGFQGIIINKQISWALFKELDLEFESLKRAPLFYGGPVREHELPLVSVTRKEFEGYVKLVNNIYYGDPIATRMAIERIRSGERLSDDFWFFLGHSSWAWNQLFEELAAGAWNINESLTGSLDWPAQ